MITLPAGLTDMRKGFDGLSALVQRRWRTTRSAANSTTKKNKCRR